MWDSGSYLQYVILLFPVPQSATYVGNNLIDGRFFMRKGGGNVWDVVEVSANCVYGSLYYNLQAFGQYSTNAKLCVCTYNGVQYYAFKCPYHSNPYTNVEFIGRICSDLTGGTSTVNLPLQVPYYNENTSTVLNSEVYNSITETLTTTYVTYVKSCPLRSEGGFTGNLTGNADTATILKPTHNTDTVSAAVSFWAANTGSGKIAWSEAFKESSYGTDTGDIILWLNQNTAADGTELNITIDGNFYAEKDKKVIHSGNIGSQSVNYASSAGQASRIPVYTSDPSSLTAGQIWINTSV